MIQRGKRRRGKGSGRNRIIAWLMVGALGLAPEVRGADLLRSGAAISSGQSAATAPATVLPAAAPALTTAQDRLARATQALAAVRQMQTAARNLALAGANNLRASLPVVPVNSYGLANGLVPAAAVPKVLASPTASEDAALWTGASLPVVATATAGGATTSTVTITQTSQQAILNWQSFNLGKTTTLAFDQSAGGANVGQWIAFNFVRDPTVNPTQILGTMKTVGPADSAGQATVGGQVYVMNVNGIIFGGSAQVNAHGLVAATLPLNFNLIARGLLNNPDTQFQFSTLALPAGSRGPTPAFDPAVASADGAVPIQTPIAADGHYGDIEVQAGASLVAPTNADRVGGRVALIGANVSNAGTLSTPNGQAILAAGLQVGLTASSDSTLRGLNVYVGAVGDYAGTATNALDQAHAVAGSPVPGLIDGRRADGSVADAAVTIVGRNVNQLGAIDATTSVSLNARVDLLAEYNAIANSSYLPGQSFSEFLRQSTATDVSTGTVTLGAGSLTSLRPDLTDPERIIGTQLALPSTVNLRGRVIHLAAGADPSSGAVLLAPNARVALDAGQWSINPPLETFVHTTGQVYFDSGATIDVTGSQGVNASVAENIVEVELRGPQLADFPLQRDGALRGSTVSVDLRQVGTYNGRAWIGTPLADATGYIGLVSRTVGELTTAGGAVAINAGGSVVLNKNASIEVSGGWIDYQGAVVATTKLLSAGRVFDIAQATPDRIYDSIYTGRTTTTDPKWGTTQTSSNPLVPGAYEPGYRQGGNGGSLTLTAPAMVLEGTLRGSSVAGQRQRTPIGQLAKTYAGASLASVLPVIEAALGAPARSTLSLAFEQEYLLGTRPLLRSPTAPDVVITAKGAVLAPVAAFPGATSGQISAALGNRGVQGAEVDLAPNLVSADPQAGGGFGSLAVRNSEGAIRIRADLTAGAGGALNFEAANLTVDDNLTLSAPAGSLTFVAHNYSPYSYQAGVVQNDYTLPLPDPLRGGFKLGKGATLSTAGQWVDDRGGQPGAGTAALFTNGYRFDAAGSEVDAISIRAYRVDLADGSTLDVSGGVAAGATGKFTFGGAGRISVQGVLDPQGDVSLPMGQDPTNPADTAALRGYLKFNPDRVRFKGYAGVGGKSGTLSLQAQQIQVENPAARGTAADLALRSPANLDPAGTLILAPDFFGRDGIGNYNLTGLGSLARDAAGNEIPDPQGPGSLYVPGVYVAPTILTAAGVPLATAIAARPFSWVAVTSGSAQAPLSLVPAVELLPVGARAASSLKLSAPGVVYNNGGSNILFFRGDLKVAKGASLDLDPKAVVTLSGHTVQLDGSVTAPAGTINVTGGSAYLVAPNVTLADPVLPTVELGANARLNAAGVAVGPAGLALNPGLNGNLNTGAVLAGGKILVAGNLVAQKGAVLDVTGATGTLDLLPGYSGGSAAFGLVPAVADSDGGSISLQGAQLLVTNATLKGAAGGPSALGGSLSLSSGSYSTSLAAYNLEVSQTGPTLPTGGSLLGRPAVDASGTSLSSLGHFAASDFSNPQNGTSVGGFANLTLGGNVEFLGDVSLAALRSLTVGTGGFIYSRAAGTNPSQAVRLAAPSVTLGLPFAAPVATAGGTIPQVSILKDASNAPFYVAPTPGSGTLEVQAGSVISLGSISFQGISTANFRTMSNGHAVAGDLRGDGVVDIAGSLAFTVGQIYPPTAVNFTLAAYDYLAADGSTQGGSITINPVLDSAGQTLLPALPLSAGGQLTLYASTITQGGVLRAPFGTINLGWNGTGNPATKVNGAPGDLLVGPSLLPVPVTASLTLGKGSVTSVSAVDPKTGLAMTIPYGYSSDGTTWFDPTGTDITVLGPPSKSVTLSARSIVDEKGSVVDISGGGDLYAYQWVTGVGGTRDVLDPNYVPNPSAPTLQSFAVIPGYQVGFAPYAPFGSAAADPGYAAGTSLTLGDTVHLDLGNGKGAQDYTLLPARYALLPGAYLVTPLSGAAPSAAVRQPDGATVVAGYRTNSLTPLTAAPLRVAFEVALGTPAKTSATGAPTSVVRDRAQYTDFLANTFFAPDPLAAMPTAFRRPVDAGSLLFTASGGGTVTFDGSISAGVQPNTDGRGGVVDISTPSDVLITASKSDATTKAALAAKLGLVNPLMLTASTLNNFGVVSLLIGGYRTAGSNGANVQVTTGRLAVANAGEPLSGSDVILVARTSLQFDDRAVISPSGNLTNSDLLIFGQLDANGAPVAGSGNGTLTRISSDPAAQSNRFGANQSTTATLTVGPGVTLGSPGATSGSVTIDSTNATTLDPTATLRGKSLAIGSGQISIQFPDAGNLRVQAGGKTTTGVVLTSAALAAFQTSADALTLLSYSSLDLYGSGVIGSSSFSSIALHTPEIYGDGGGITLKAASISLDNRAASGAPDIPGTVSSGGALKFDSQSFNLGAGTVAIDRYPLVTVNATTGVNFSGTGALAAAGDLLMTAPYVTGATAAVASISANGALTVAGAPGNPGSSGLGAKLSLTGASVSAGGHIQLPDGTLNLRATGAAGSGDLVVTGILDTAGAVKKFYDLPKYTEGGSISLGSDHGNVTVAGGGLVDVSGALTDPADPAGNGRAYASAAGSLGVAAPEGTFAVAGQLAGHGTAAGQGADFTLDAGSLPTVNGGPGGSLRSLALALTAGGYDRAETLRVRTGDVTVDGTFTAQAFALSADSGSIAVTGRIDASGTTGGSISLAARGGVSLAPGAVVAAVGDGYSSAGKGGRVTVEAGTSKFDATGAAVTPAATAVIDLQGTIDVRTGVESVALTAGAGLSFPSGVTGGNAITFSAAGKYRQVDGRETAFAAGEYLTLPAGCTVVLTKDGTAQMGGTGAGGSVPVQLADGTAKFLRPAAGTPAAQAAALADSALGRNSGTVHLRAPQIDAAGVPVPAGTGSTAGTEVAVRPLAGSILGASSVVVEGYRVFTPTGGVIDTVESAVLANGQSFAGLAGNASTPGPIFTRLLGGVADPAARSALAAVLHVRPGAEIVNAASAFGTSLATLTAGTTNSTLQLNAGGSFTLSALAAATSRIVSTTDSGRIILPDGSSRVLLAADTNVPLAAGSTVVLDSAGTVTLSVAKTGSASGSGSLRLENGTTLTGASGLSLDAGSGTTLALNAAGVSSVTVAAATPVVMVNGGRVRFSSAGAVLSATGVTSSFAAAATVTISAGSTVTLISAGSITYSSGTTPVQLAVSKGVYQLAGAATVSPATGDLQLSSDWNLATYRYPAAVGAPGEPGMLTLRAAGNLKFNGALSDGFASAAYDAALLGAGTASTSYRLVAGADFAAAAFRQTQPLTLLGVGTGSVLLGQIGTGTVKTGANALTKDAVVGHFQVIRTGTGDIDLAAGRDVLLLNQFATIYTAGTSPADVTMGGKFDTPVLDQNQYNIGLPLGSPQEAVSYPAQFTLTGGDVMVSAQGDIAHKTRDGFGRLIDDSEQQLPNNWLFRRGLLDPATGLFFQGQVDGSVRKLVANSTGEVKSTAWWVDFSNFFEGVGALGGGNVTLKAGRDIANVDAVVPTNARMAGRNAAGAVVGPDLNGLVELGGGNLVVQAGRDLNGGAYYVERGQGTIDAGRNVTTNATRSFGRVKTVAETWLPTTLFLGKGDFAVTAAGDLRLGPVANVFLLPAGISNTPWDKTYFSTFSPDDSVEVTSLTGAVRLSENAPDGILYSWLNAVQLYNSANASFTRPWLRLTENSVASFKTVTTLAPSTLKVTAFTGTLNVAGNLNLAASPTGTIEFAAQGTITGLNPLNNAQNWSYGVVRLLDSASGAMPGPAAPLATTDWAVSNITFNGSPLYAGLDGLLQEGESSGNDSLQTKLARHGSGPLHAGDASPLRIYSEAGDITGLSLFSGKMSRVVAGRDLTDVSLVLQNTRPADISLVAAGRDLVAFAPNTPQRQSAGAVGFIRADERTAGKSGLIEIGGPGTLEVLTGRNLDLGIDPASAAPGIVSVGSRRNPNLPFGGADVTVAAGLGVIYSTTASTALLAPGLQSANLDFANFIAQFIGPAAENRLRYLPYLGAALGMQANTPAEDIASAVTKGPLTEGKALALLDTFYQILRTSGRDRNDPASPNFGTYTDGLAAISALFPGSPIPSKDDIASGTTAARPAGPATGNVSMATKEMGTFEGGDISILAPNGRVTVGRPVDAQKPDQGVLTQRGGNIAIYATDNVDVGTSRIFTLRGGNEDIWSTWGNIAAGSGSKTVHAAPPTRVLIDPQSADVQNDLAGLATGSGIGVLATLVGVKPGDVDLIAPVGTIDAGDAGIRASGNLNVAARVVLNSSNIQVGGVSVGTPPPPPAPNLGSLGAAATVSAGASSAAADVAKQGATAGPMAELPSIIAVEVLGYGGGDGTETPDSDGAPGEDDQNKKPRSSF